VIYYLYLGAEQRRHSGRQIGLEATPWKSNTQAMQVQGPRG